MRLNDSKVNEKEARALLKAAELGIIAWAAKIKGSKVAKKIGSGAVKVVKAPYKGVKWLIKKIF